MKPTVPMLKTEVLRRASNTGKGEPRCGRWTGPQLISWLATHVTDSTDEVDKAEMERLTPVVAAEGLEDTPGSVRWKKNSMLPLLINYLLFLKSDFPERDATVSRACLDAKGRFPSYSMMTRTPRPVCCTMNIPKPVMSLRG